MSKNKKPPLTERTDKEVIKKLFPKKIIEKANEVAHEKDKNK